MRDEILTDLSTAALAGAVKHNLYALFRDLGRWPGTVYYHDLQFARWQTPFPHPWLNGVLCERAPGPGAQPAIQVAMNLFAARGVPQFTWWLEPDVPAAAWSRILVSRGFIPDGNTPGMAVALEALNEQVPAPAGLRVAPVENQDDLQVWAQTFTRGYELPPNAAESLYALVSGLGLGWPYRHYLAYLDGQPVSTATMFLGAGVAGIYYVATVPEARGQGVGAAVTLAPLLEARALGYKAGILQSSDMGYRIYERLGFRTVCQVDHHTWTDPRRG